jgi:hypothetical protein
MKKYLYLICLVLTGLMVKAQSCADLFGVGTYTLTAVCSPGGVAQYPLTFTQINSTSFTIAGFRNESTGVVTATCSGTTFSFPMTQLPSGFYVVGNGTWTGTGPTNVSYGVYNSSMVKVDSCAGTYTAPVGITNPKPSFTVSISPNPAQQAAQIDVFSSMTGTSYTWNVYDMQGRRILNGNMTNQGSAQVDLSLLGRGTYKVVVSDGSNMIVKSLVRQ